MIKPPFQTRTDISRWLATKNETFAFDCASFLSPQEQLNKIWLDSQPMQYVFLGGRKGTKKPQNINSIKKYYP